MTPSIDLAPNQKNTAMAIVLKINNREITEKELLEEWQQVKKSLPPDKTLLALSDNERITLRYAKQNIINRVILEEEAELIVNEIDYALIQAEYNNILSHYQGWEKMTSHFKNPLSPYKIKANIEKSLKVNQLLEIWTKNVSPPNEAEMMSYYEHNWEKFTHPQQILFSKFFLPHDPSQQNQILMEGLASYREKQKNYRDFIDKALQIPNLDYQEKFYLIPGQIHSQVEEILTTLRDEEISGIIRTEEGYYIFKRWSVIPPVKMEYDQVRSGIADILFKEKKQKKIREQLIDLRKQAAIEDYFPEPEKERDSLV